MIDGLKASALAVREWFEPGSTVSGISLLRNDDPTDLSSFSSLYSASVTVAVCLEVLVDAVSQTRLRLVNDDGDEVDPPPGLSFNLDEPSTGFSQQMWLNLAVHDLKLTGNVFGYKPEAVLSGARLVDPTLVRVEGLGRYEINATLNETSDTMFHIFKPTLGSRIQGESPLVQVAGVIGLEVEYPAFLARYFRNGAHIGGVLHTEMTAQQLKDAGRHIVQDFANQFRQENQHRLAALGKGSRYEAFEVNLQGLTDEGLGRFIDSRILNAMRVPRVLVETLLSTGSGLNSDVYRTQARAWWNGSVRSFLRLISGGLTMAFRDELGTLRFDFDLSDVGPLQLEKAEAASWVLPVYEAGLITQETAQKELGVPIDATIQPPDVTEAFPGDLEGLPQTIELNGQT
ncbi:MAG: phage portal protein [Rhodospirillaceae bacterium]|nr:phage portal protein [Rhodospirillaceae bacterium]